VGDIAVDGGLHIGGESGVTHVKLLNSTYSLSYRERG
jgi:hypothetical protein